VADKVAKVRKQALRGLGNMTSSWNSQVSMAATSILSALTSASEDNSPEVAAEAVSALTRVAGVVEASVIGPMVINIVFRLRPSLDRKEDSVRCAAFKLFGVLCRFGTDDMVRENFVDQTHQNLPIYLVHANDENEEVSTEAIVGLTKIFELLGSEECVKVCSEYSVGGNYDGFLEQVLPSVLRMFGSARMRAYVDSSMNFFTSHWTVCRANSAYLTGCLLKYSSEANRKRINNAVIVSGLIGLLKDSSAVVRSKSIKSLALLNNA
jgi:hypothetical protein